MVLRFFVPEDRPLGPANSVCRCGREVRAVLGAAEGMTGLFFQSSSSFVLDFGALLQPELPL